MSGQKRPSTGLRDCKIESSASGQYLTIFFVLLNSRVPRGRESLTWFNSSRKFDRGSEAAALGAPEFEYEQGMQADPTEGFQGGDDAGTGTANAHSHLRAHLCTHTCVHRYTRKHTKAHACAHVYTHVHVRSRTRTRMHVTNLSTHANAYTPARTTHMHARHT